MKLSLIYIVFSPSLPYELHLSLICFPKKHVGYMKTYLSKTAVWISIRGTVGAKETTETQIVLKNVKTLQIKKNNNWEKKLKIKKKF